MLENYETQTFLKYLGLLTLRSVKAPELCVGMLTSIKSFLMYFFKPVISILTDTVSVEDDSIEQYLILRKQTNSEEDIEYIYTRFLHVVCFYVYNVHWIQVLVV